MADPGELVLEKDIDCSEDKQQSQRQILVTQPLNKQELSAKQREREEKVRVVQKKKADERKKKLEELRDAQKRASEFREKQQEERRQRLIEMRNKEAARRDAVEQRRKQMEEVSKNKIMEKMRRLEERDARVDGYRRSRLSGQPTSPDGSQPRRSQSHYSLRPVNSPQRAVSARSLSTNVSNAPTSTTDSPRNSKRLSASVATLPTTVSSKDSSKKSTTVKDKSSRMTSSTVNLRSSKTKASTNNSPRTSKSVVDANGFENKLRSISVDCKLRYARPTCNSAIRSGRFEDRLLCCHVRSYSADTSSKVSNKPWSTASRTSDRLSTPKRSSKISSQSLQENNKPADNATYRKTVKKASDKTPATKKTSQEIIPMTRSKSPSPSSASNTYNVSNENEYKMKLAENRRLAREKAEKKAEEDRLRKEKEKEQAELLLKERKEAENRKRAELKLIEEERQRKEAEEKEKRLEEEKRLQDEQALKDEIERKEKEEAEQRAKEETEQRERERLERQAKEEEERQERKRKLEGIMKRFKPDGTSSSETTPSKPVKNGNFETPSSDLKSSVLQKVFKDKLETNDKKFQSPILQDLIAKRSNSSSKLNNIEQINAESLSNNNQLINSSNNAVNDDNDDNDNIEQVINLDNPLKSENTDDLLNSNAKDESNSNLEPPSKPFVAFEENANEANRLAGNA